VDENLAEFRVEITLDDALDGQAPLQFQGSRIPRPPRHRRLLVPDHELHLPVRSVSVTELSELA
jgi:hypothetical protein